MVKQSLTIGFLPIVHTKAYYQGLREKDVLRALITKSSTTFMDLPIVNCVWICR